MLTPTGIHPHDYYNYPQTAELLRISVRTLGRLVHDRDIAVVRLRGQVWFTPEGIREYIARCSRPCRREATS